jgi:hypothetical protein
MVSLRLATIAILFGLASSQAPVFGQEQERKPLWGPFQSFVGEPAK